MGLHTDTGSNGNIVFLTPINTDKGAMWARRVTADTEGAVMRDAKCGTVYELYYKGVSGFIQAVRIVDKGEYGDELEVALRDDEEGSDLIFLLQMSFNSELGKGFICRMENINPDDVVTVGLYTKGKKRYLWVNQNDEAVANPYVKDGEKELPPPETTKRRGGKVEYNWAKHDDALFELCEKLSIDSGWAEDDDQFRLSSFIRATDDDMEPDDATTEDDVPF